MNLHWVSWLSLAIGLLLDTSSAVCYIRRSKHGRGTSPAPFFLSWFFYYIVIVVSPDFWHFCDAAMFAPWFVNLFCHFIIPGVYATWFNGRTWLHRAAELGSTRAVDVLLSHGADLTARDNAGWSALGIAAVKGYVGMVALLISRGAALDMGFDPADRAGLQSPARLAAIGGRTKVVKLFVSMGLPINNTDGVGSSLLNAAVWFRSRDLVKYLLENGADIESTDPSWIPPLHMAVASGNARMVRLLLDYGADINSCHDGMTPLQQAIRKHDRALVRLLTKRGANA